MQIVAHAWPPVPFRQLTYRQRTEWVAAHGMPVPSVPFERMTRDERAHWADVVGILPPRGERRRWSVAVVVGPLISRLTVRSPIGWCNASQPSLRIMSWVDTGYAFGENSIGRWARREKKRGRLEHEPVAAGWTFHRNKRRVHAGCQLNRWPSEKIRREKLWRAAKERRIQRQAARRRAEAEREEQKRREREARRRRERAPQLVGVVAQGEPAIPFHSAEARDAIARVLAAVQAPAAVEPLRRPVVDAGPTEAELRAVARERAAEAMRAFELRDLDDGWDDPPET